MADESQKPPALLAFLRDRDQFTQRFILAQVLGPPPSKRAPRVVRPPPKPKP